MDTNTTAQDRARVHMFYPELFARFRRAREAWRYIEQFDGAALGLDERTYCMSFIQLNYPPLTFAGNATNDIPAGASDAYWQAWRDSE